MTKTRIILAAYVAIALATFGRSAAQFQADCARIVHSEAACIDLRAKTALGAVFAGIGWPLYWSWEAWS